MEMYVTISNLSPRLFSPMISAMIFLYLLRKGLIILAGGRVSLFMNRQRNDHVALQKIGEAKRSVFVKFAYFGINWMIIVLFLFTISVGLIYGIELVFAEAERQSQIGAWGR